MEEIPLEDVQYNVRLSIFVVENINVTDIQNFHEMLKLLYDPYHVIRGIADISVLIYHDIALRTGGLSESTQVEMWKWDRFEHNRCAPMMTNRCARSSFCILSRLSNRRERKQNEERQIVITYVYLFSFRRIC